MKIANVCQLPGEAERLCVAIADFSRDGSRSDYADWLETQGDQPRAKSVHATIEAFHSLNAKHLDDLQGEIAWQDMIAASLLQKFINSMDDFPRKEIESFRDVVFAQLRPALSLTSSAMSDEPDLGTSRLWGQPDLPSDQTWPKIAEVSNWFDSKEDLPHEKHCAFVGQFSYSELTGTVLGQQLPATGGFSVFAITEANKLGIVETVVRPWENTQELSRRATPPDLQEDSLGDQVNIPSPAETIHLTEVLSLPDATGGPFASIIPDSQWGEPFYDFYADLMNCCNEHKMGLGGYLRATSGDDPSPDTCARRFAVLPTTPDTGTLHFSIPADDVKEGRLDRVSYVWNDWDS